MLGSRYEQTGEMRDLEEAIRLAELAVQSTPEDHPRRPACLKDLGNQLGRRYEQTGQMQDLEEAIQVTELSVQSTPKDHPDRADCLSNLGNKLGRRYERTRKMQDLEEAIRVTELAVQLTPEDHPRRAFYLDNLGNNLHHRYERIGQMQDLEEAIRVTELAVQSTSEDHPDRADYLNSLGKQLESRYEQTGQMQDLEEAIRVAQLAVQSTPEDHPRRAVYLNNLGNELGSRYERTEQMQDLEEAIRVAELALQSTLKGHLHWAAYLNNLGIKLRRRYEQVGQMRDLEEAIRVAELAVQSTPEDHPDWLVCLSNLGILLKSQYKQTGGMQDLEEAIRVVELAVQSTPENHPDRASWLNDLGIMLRSRYEQTGEMQDLEKAIRVTELAVQLIPEDHPDRPTLLLARGRATLYEPLPSPTSIRLVSLIMTPESDIIECTMNVYELDSAPLFAAVSYAWGERHPTHAISCNGISGVQVTRNLHEALFRLRRHSKTIARASASMTPDSAPDPFGPECYYDVGTGYMIRRLWIDSLCINQEDNEEKGQQVRIMGKIYSQAVRVITCLVDSSFVDAPMMQMLVWASVTQLKLQKSPTLEFDEANLPDPGSPAWASCLRVFQNEYFERVWVIQEIALAKFAVVFMADHEMDWSILGSAATFFKSKKEYWQKVQPLAPFDLTENPFTQAHNIWSLCWRQDQAWPLLSLLHQFHNRKAKLGMDKVFGLLSLSPKYPVVVDYGRTDPEVFRQTARAIIQQDGNLDVLSSVPWTQFHHVPLGVGNRANDTYIDDDPIRGFMFARLLIGNDDLDTTPPYSEITSLTGDTPSSWAPYWNVVDFGPEVQPLLHWKAPYDASAGLPANISLGKYEPLLEVEGAQYDTIETCSPVTGDVACFYLTDEESNFPIRLKELFEDSFQENKELKGTVEDRKWAFAMAIVAGRNFEWVSADNNPSFQEEARAYWESILGEPFLNQPKACQNSSIKPTPQDPEDKADSIAAPPSTGATQHSQDTQIAPHTESVGTSAMVIGNNYYHFPVGSRHSCKECTVARNYCAQVWAVNYRRRIFRTKSGYFGLGSSNIAPGDQVVILFGGKVPFVLRKKEGYYRLISDCYVHGIMNGELVKEWQKELVQSVTFPIL